MMMTMMILTSWAISVISAKRATWKATSTAISMKISSTRQSFVCLLSMNLSFVCLSFLSWPSMMRVFLAWGIVEGRRKRKKRLMSSICEFSAKKPS